MLEILGFTSKKMIFEIENWYFCVVFSTNRTNLLNWLIKSANRKWIVAVNMFVFFIIKSKLIAPCFCSLGSNNQ
jgi:hypothetical protein